MKNAYKKIAVCLALVFWSISGLMAQGAPCFTNNSVKLFANAPDTVAINQPFSINVAAVNNAHCVDTLYTNNGTLTKQAGPGSLSGSLAVNFIKGMANFNNVFINGPGNYSILIHSGTLTDTVVSIVAVNSGGTMPCLGAGPATKLKFDMVPVNVTVNSPFMLNVSAFGNNNCVDTLYTGSVTLTKFAGPGNLAGVVTMNFNKGMVQFNNLSVNQQGGYRFIASSGALLKDTTLNINATGGGGTPCPPTTAAGSRKNMGLYGGSSLDLTFLNANNRLFAAISSPASLFYTDDLCATWHRAFPDDSLEYGCGKGWGGRAVRVLTNNTGWVAVQTSQEAGTLNALVVSYTHGDTGTWKTAMDGKMMNALGLGSVNVGGMGLSDYYMYCLMGKYIIRIHNSAAINMSSDVINVTSAISGLNSNSTVKSIAAANQSTGYPIYFVVDTTGSFGNSSNGVLYKYNGTTYSVITLPAGLSGAGTIFTHPAQVTGDTLFLTGMAGPNQKLYRSYNGGTSWTDISAGPGNWSLSDVDYSAGWVSSMPSSNGCVLLIPGVSLSTDLGTTWQPINLQNNGGAVHPTTPTTVVGTKGRGVVVSTTGASGTYTTAVNYGLEAVTIKKIARTQNKGLFYIATKAGLAYTTAYLDTNIVGYNKWNAPYGEFPVANVGDDAGVFSVAIDPNDSLHVIAGYSNGFAVTTTGITGFANVNPAGWNNMDDPRANDILFINSNVVIAVSGGDNQVSAGKGNIWRSTNGGQSWTKVSPTGFSNGNTIAKGNNATDTVIYIGTGLSDNILDSGKIWKSSNLGVTWTKVNDGPTSTTNPLRTKMPIYDLAVDPRGIDTLYIASGANLDHAFVKSTDGGITYQYINAHGEGAFTSVAINQHNPDTVYTAIRRDILMYDAINDTANYIYRGLPGELVPDLAFGSVLAGTSMGFFKIKEEIIPVTTGIKNPVKVYMDEVRAYPNPFESMANIAFTLTTHSQVTLKVYDLTGREIKTIYSGSLHEGQHILQLNGDGLAEGTYLITLITDKKVSSKRVVKIR